MSGKSKFNAGVAVMRKHKSAYGIMGGLCLAALMLPTTAAAQFGGYPTQTPQEAAAQIEARENARRDRDENEGKPTRLVVDQSVRGPDGYRTIQAAVNDIAEGGVIIVMPGEYNENLDLTKAVTLQGDRGPGMRVRIAPQNGSKPCMTFSPQKESAHLMVSNIEFTTVEMSHSVTTGKPGASNSDDLRKMANASAYGSQPCVLVEGGVFTMKESTVTGLVDQYNANYAGASLYEYARNDIAESYYSRDWDNDQARYYKGAMVEVTGGIATLEKNIIRGGLEGVRVSQKSSYRDSTFLVDNIISENSLHGVYLTGMSGVQAAANYIDGNGIGIAYNGEGEATVVGNKIQHSLTDGMYLGEKARQITMSENFIASNRGNGIKIIRANGFIRDDNTFENNGWGGPDFYDVNTLDAGYNNVPKIDNSIAVNVKTDWRREQRDTRSRW